MTKQTLMKSMYLIAKSFEKFQAHKDEELMLMWWDVFKGEDEMVFQTAVKRLITTFQYQVPTIANLNHILSELKNVKKIEPGDVYDEINKAIRYYGFYRLEEGFNSLSPIAQSTVNAIGGFRNVCLSDNIMADRAHALKIAKNYIEREAKENLLTNSMKREQLEVKERMKQLTDGIGQ